MGITVAEALFLMESLDSMYKIGPPITIDSGEYHHTHGITNHVRHDLDDTKSGYLHVWKRAGAYEIHHSLKGKTEDDDINMRGISGKWVPSGKTNPKFVATMAHVAKTMLKNGRAVRIVGTDDKMPNGKTMFHHYNKLSHIIAKKNGYAITQVGPYTLDSENNKGVSQLTISPIKEEYRNIISNMFLENTQMANESNDYHFGQPVGFREITEEERNHPDFMDFSTEKE